MDKSVKFKKNVTVRRCLNLSSPSQWVVDDVEKLHDHSPDSEDSGFSELLSTDSQFDDTTEQHFSVQASNKLSTTPTPTVSSRSHVDENERLLTATSMHDGGLSEYAQPMEAVPPAQASWYSPAYVMRDLFISALMLGICYCILSFTSVYVSDMVSLILKSLAITLFLYIVTYFDSKEPGLTPPTPFTARNLPGKKSVSLSYIMTAIYGLVFFTCYYSNWYQSLTTAS